MDESPKWLLMTGKFEEARSVLVRITEKNEFDKNIDVDNIIRSSKALLREVSNEIPDSSIRGNRNLELRIHCCLMNAYGMPSMTGDDIIIFSFLIPSFPCSLPSARFLISPSVCFIIYTW